MQRALLLRPLSQLAQVYLSITIDNLLSLIQPLRNTRQEWWGLSNVTALEFVNDHFSGLDKPHLPCAASSFNLQPRSLVHTRLSSIATTLNHAPTLLEPPPVSTAEEQCARVAALVTAADAERKALQLRHAIVLRQRELVSELAVWKEKREQSRRSGELRLAKYESITSVGVL